MKLNRRKFLQTSAGGAVLALTAGCDRFALSFRGGFSRPDTTPFRAPVSASIDTVSHVLNRLSFGPPPGEYQRVRSMGASDSEAARAYIEEQLRPETIDDPEPERLLRNLESTGLGPRGLYEYHAHFLQRELVADAILRAVYSRRQLYEVMVHFWTDHFNISSLKGECPWLKPHDDHEVIRKHALGVSLAPQAKGVLSWFQQARGGDSPAATAVPWKFQDMLRASALSPAMLDYLDGRENRKTRPEDRPNENYARELLELHTLGVYGGYKQQDIMEVARCLTGWTVRGRGFFNRPGEVRFEPGLHDDGPKAVLGQQIPAGLGARDLDAVLQIVCSHPSTARHIATKLCRRFIADEPPKPAVETVAGAFSRSGGDIRETLRALFSTEEFLQARGTKLKRPFHYLVSALRGADARVLPVVEVHEDGPLHRYLSRMGHAPFHYPTPDGYPEEAAHWSGSLLWRWKFARTLGENQVEHTLVDWELLKQRAGGDEALMAHLLGRRPTAAEIEEFQSSGEGPALCLASPAFQMC